MKLNPPPPYTNRTSIVATSLLVISLTLFCVSSWFEATYPWVSWVKSFSEAASVGAIADWFAVTALFRHPLGLPIPHTAIIARQRDRLAKGLGEFIDRNFLSGDVIRRKIVDDNISLTIVEWASQEQNAKRVSLLLKQLVDRSLYLFDDAAFLNLLNKNLNSALEEVPFAPFCGRLLKFVMESDTDQEVFAAAVTFADTFVSEKGEAIENFIASKLPWYVPTFIHKTTFNQFLQKLKDEIAQMEINPNHPVRNTFRQQILNLAGELETSVPLYARGEKIKRLILESTVFDQYVARFTQRLSAELREQLADLQSPLSKMVEKAAGTLISQIKDDAALQEALNQWLFDIVNNLVGRSSLNFSYLVQEVVSSWDTKTLVARIEEQVSSDLQYIRINGTIIGGCVGLTLHAVSLLIP